MSTIGRVCKPIKATGLLLMVLLVGAVLAFTACTPWQAKASPSEHSDRPGPTPSIVSTEAPLATPVPRVPAIATPLPPPRWPIYILDPNDGRRISRILTIDPDQQRMSGSVATRYLPSLAVSPDGLRLYVADTYWSQVTRGDARDVLSVYHALDRVLLVDDLPMPGRLKYKVYPLGEPYLFLSEDGGRLFLMKYGGPDQHQLRLSILDSESLEVLHEGPSPPCGRRVQVLADRWVCANTVFPTETPSVPDFSVSVSLDAVDPWTGQKLETLLRVENLHGGVADLALSSSSDQLFVVHQEMEITVIDISQGRLLERVGLEVAEEWQFTMEAMALSPDGQRLLLGFARGEDRHRALVNQVWVYDTGTWERMATIELRDPAMDFSFSAAGDQIYVVSPVGQSLAIYDAATYEEISLLSDLGGSPARVVIPGVAR